MHTVTGKLNQDARLYSGDKGDTFFISLGEKHYDYKTKESGWTNYEAAIFSKPTQRDYMINNLKAGAVVSVSGKTLIIENNEQYGPKLHIQNAEIEYVFNPATPMPNEVRSGLCSPEEQARNIRAQSQLLNNPAQQQAPVQQQAPPVQNDFNSDYIPF